MTEKLRRKVLAAALMVAFALTLTAASAAFAQEEPPPLPTPTFPDEMPPLPEVQVMEDTALWSGRQFHHFLVEFQGPPAARLYAQALASGQSEQGAAEVAKAAVESYRMAQASVRPTLEANGATVLYGLQRIFNGVAIYLDDPSRLDAIRAIPGVKAVHVLPLHKPDTETSVPFIGAPGVWETYGLTGEDVTIAIIDTGIDYLHLGFGGDPSLYPWQDPTVINVDGVPFPTDKVIAGYDLVGENYDASGEEGSPIPVPDDDPTDCYGHGSHVAGIAAAYGVYDDAGTPTTFYGPWDSTIYGAYNWIVAPGVAPEAKLVALKVFGCAGSTAVVPQALEMAVDPNGDGDFSDHYDIINMSLGAPYGSPDDIDVIVTDNAALAGVIVAASAGNEGDAYFITGSPASAVRAISTAASADDGLFALALRDGDGVDYLAIPAAFGPPITTPITATLEVPSGNPRGCDPDDFSGFTPGNMALIDRGACPFVTKVKNAQDAGAVAAVITNVTTNIPFTMGGADPTITIPSVMISGDDGWAIKAKLPTTGTLDPSLTIPLADTLASFSSRGPRRGHPVLLKPDITTPGSNITSVSSAYDGSGNQISGPAVNPGADALTISGTSMSAPHTAGAMALLREAHPDTMAQSSTAQPWTVEELKALAMNTAVHDIDLLPGWPQVGPGRVGAGRIDVGAALNTQVIAYNGSDPGTVSMAFDFDVPGTSKGSVSKQLFITNKGGVAQTYTLTLDQVVNAPGLKLKIDPALVTVPAYTTVTVTVQVQYDGAKMLKTCDASVDPPAGVRHCLNEESGYIVLTPTSGQLLRVPYFVTAEPASNTNALVKKIFTPPLAVVDIPLVGTGVNVSGGEDYQNQFSWVSAYELMGRSMNDAWSVGMAENADIKAVGVSADPYYWNNYFAIATYGEWNTPAEVEFDIYIDTDQDGTEDWILLNCTGSGGTQFLVCFVDLWGVFGYGPGALLSFGTPLNELYADVDTHLFNQNVMMIGSYFYYFDLVSYFFFGDDDTTFDFWVVSWSRDSEDAVDCAPLYNPACGGSDVYTYNHFTPNALYLNYDLVGYDGYLPMWPDQGGSAVTAEVYGAAEIKTLLLHHYNPPDKRAEVVTISTEEPTLVELVSNGGFESGDLTDWTPKNLKGSDGVTSANANNGTYSMLFNGGATKTRKLKQVVSSGGSAGDQFILSAASYPDGAVGTASVKAIISYVDGTKEKITLDLMGPDGAWSSYSSGTFVADKDYTQIKVVVKVNLSSGAIYVDDVSLLQLIAP